jgi:diguanylate cyclase (GGDEF)-like protein
MAEAQSSILIVDDDAEDLASVERALRSLGCNLVTVKDPHEVMPGVHRIRPDVVVLDALLPGLSGFDLCKQIKSDPQLKSTQVLILTGVYLRQQYRHEAIQQFKADAFLTKPFRPPELQRLVVQLLSRKTRMPQSSFLRRIGLPPSSEPKKRGFLGRIFGRGEVEEPLPIRIAPVARDIPQPAAPAAAVVELAAPPPVETVEPAPSKVESLEPPQETAPPASEAPTAPTPETEAAAVVSETKPESETKTESEVVPTSETPPEPPPVAVKQEVPIVAAAPPPPAPEPAAEAPIAPVDEAPVETPSAEAAPEPESSVTAPEGPVQPGPPSEAAAPAVSGEIVEAAKAEAPPEKESPPQEPEVEPPPSAALDAPPPSEVEEVTWIQADSRTQEMTLEEAAARVAEEMSAKEPPEDLGTAPPSGDAEPEEAAAEQPSAAAGTSQPLRRPLFRVGEVPIYDEPDFLTELKRELSKCKRVDRPLTLILIRVGDLGQIIELFGKDFREPVLWHIAEQAMESLREVDLVGMMSSKNLIAMTAFASDRYGGGRIVSRMRQAVAKKPFRVGEELPPIIPELDFGMASFPADGNEVTNLIHRAEEDLTNGKDSKDASSD